MTEYVTQNIRTVLKTFQNSAPKSLQGPGHSLQAASGPLDASHAGGGSGGGDHTQSAVGNAHTLSPCSANAGGDHCHLSGSAAAQSTVPPPVALIKKEIFSSPEPFELNENASITIVPPPPPELPQPILSAADSGSGELYETRLEGKTIGCYSLGGEMRLCLPQFLNNVLADFTLDQINRIFDELGIFCSQCTPDQLMEFKAAKILPSDVKACGLITRTDAERLCAALLHRADRNIYINDADIPKGAISFKVYHRCFGKCEGICTPDMYSYTKPTCIMCLECKGYFSPQKFVGHVHRKQENRTCHWGFDSRNWHEYLHVALDVENRDKYQKILDELKEVEFKEAMKAQRDMSYLKRKAEMFLDDAMLGPPLGQPAILPPHQQLAANNCGGKQRELLDIPSKKLKNLDETSAYQLSEYQRYQALFYAQCMQQQRIGQMSAFRPWAPPKSFLQVPYNTVAANLPYLSQEPPVLQNPERVVRNTDRERFERTYQPNVALAPRKSILTKEREKEQREREREQRERERLEREQRERELLRVRERERSLEREREREREQRERELQQQKLQQQQQQQQQQQHVAITNLCEAELVHIKQERANTPAEVPPSPPTAEDELLLERRSNGAIEDETTMPMMSPLSLSRNQQQHHHLQQQQQHQQHQQKSNNIEMLQRRHSLHTSNSTSSTSSTSSTLSTHSLAGVCNEHEQLLLSSTSPQQQQLPAHLPPPNHQHQHQHHHHHRLQQQQQQQLLPLPQPHQHQQQLRPQHQQTPPSPPTLSPEEFSGSNEISSSTSPLPPIQTNQQQHVQQQLQTGGNSSSNNNSHNLHQQQQQQHQTQTIIATVNQHAKLLPNSACASAIMTANSNCNNVNNNNSNNELPSRIRISKNLINQPNIMRSPTPPSSNQQQQQHHQHSQQQHQQLLQHQQHYEQYKQQQRFYQQQQHQQQTQRHQNPQQQSPSQSSAANNNMSSNCLSQEARAAAGLNLSSNGGGAGVVVVTKQQQHQLLQQQQHLQQQQQNGGTHMGSEFELSTDTDDDSLNGEPDSSNMLAPWELAVEALKDTRPKDRERILQLLQKLLQDNQQYRFDNLQLSEELRKRDKQICDLQEQLYRCHQQQQQIAANQNGDSSSVITKNDESIEGMLRLPLKKSTRRDPVAAAEAISVVVMKRNQQQQSCNGLNCTQEEHERSARRDQAEESDSEMDEDEEQKCAKSMEQREAAVKREHEHQNVSENEEEDDDETQQHSSSDKERHCDNLCTEARTLHSQQQQQQQQQQPQIVDEDEDEEDDNNSRMSETDSDDANEAVKAPHTSAVATPPTATTPISPDSAATAGRLFDSSNSSDDESMKQAQMSASNALAKMVVDRQEAENDEDENDDDEEDEEDEDVNEHEHDNNDDEDDEDVERAEMVGRQTLGAETSSRAAITTTTTTTTNHEIKIKQELI